MIIFILLAMMSTPVFAIDYSLCFDFLKEKQLTDILSMDKDGTILVDQKKVDSYNAERPENIEFTKSWKSKKNSSLRYYMNVRIQKRTNGSIKITQDKTYGIKYVNLVQSSLGSPTSSEPTVTTTYTPGGSFVTVVALKVKNNKCYPAYVWFKNVTYHEGSLLFATVINREGESKKCREILDYFDKNPSVKKCTNTNSLKRLQEIIGYVDGKWKMNNKLFKELDKKLSKASKIVNMAMKELTICDDFFLTKTIQDKDLWEKDQQEKVLKKSTTEI